MKSFKTGLRDDILAGNLRPILRLSGLTDECDMSMNWHLTRQNVRASLHVRGVLPKLMHMKWMVRKLKERKNGGENKILAEIREIKSDLASLKKQAQDSMSG